MKSDVSFALRTDQRTQTTDDPSCELIGTTKRTAKEWRLRKKQTFVLKVFYDLVRRIKENDLQKLIYLSFYHELCENINQSHMHESQNATTASPYYQDKTSDPDKKTPHERLKKRFQKLASKRCVKLLSKDPFQLACTLQLLWEQAASIIDHQQHRASASFKVAERLLQAAGSLPASYSPLADQSTLLHISSLKMSSKQRQKRITAKQKLIIQEFLSIAFEFGYEYFNLSTPTLELFSTKY